MPDVYAGVDIGGTNIKIGLVTAQRRLLADASIPTQAQAGPRQAVQRSAQTIRELAAQVRLRAGALKGVGVGAPGPLDPKRGVILATPNLGWRNVPLQRLFAKACGLPAAVENDANLAAWGEAWAGAGRDCDSFVLLTLGTGIGGGLVFHRRLWSGATGSAGEIGHLTVVADGERCGCGAKGCFEAYASATALVKFYRAFAEAARRRAPGARPHAPPEPVSAHAIFQAAAAGDPVARAALDHEVKYLSLGISSAVKLLDPDKVILAGGMTNAGALLLTPLRAAVRAIVEPSFPFRPAIVVGKLGDKAGLYGAAGWAVHRTTRQ
jgi:glucokinase